MDRYKLLTGRHYEPRPEKASVEYMKDPNRSKLFEASDPNNCIVESDRNLMEQFPNKFAKVVDTPGPGMVTAQRRIAINAAIDAGPWTESDRKMLESLTDEHFQRIIARVRGVGRQIQDESDLSEGRTLDTEETPNPGGKMTKYGVEVTDEYQQAYDNQFRVYRNENNMHTILRGGLRTKPLNKDLVPHEEVENFVSEWLQENATK